MSLENATAIVTGAGRGIGRAIAIALARAGANICVAARTQAEIDDVAAEIERLGRRAIAVRMDVSRETDVVSMVSKAAKEFGGVQILVNNAGIGHFANVAELAVGDFDSMWNVNMRGVFLCTRSVLPWMIRQNAGDIVNIASLAGRNAFIGGAGYSATKWALIGFSRSLMLEVRQNNIRVITLCPGSVETGFSQPERPPRSTDAIPKADDIARVAITTLLMPRNVMVSEVDIRPTNPKG